MAVGHREIKQSRPDCLRSCYSQALGRCDWAALAGSAAAVIGRPTTRISAPAARRLRRRHHPALIAQVAAGRTDAGNHESGSPGRRPCAPARSRGRCKPRRPARRPWRAPPSVRPAPPKGRAGRREASAASSRLVSTVTAISAGRGCTSAIACAAARIIASPPAAWTLKMPTPSRRDGARRARDRVGNVVELGVGKHRQARPRRSGASPSGPCALMNSSPTFKPPTCGFTARATAMARDQDPVCRGRRKRDWRTRSFQSLPSDAIGHNRNGATMRTASCLAVAVQPFAQFLARAEKRRAFLVDRRPARRCADCAPCATDAPSPKTRRSRATPRDGRRPALW